MKKFLMLLLLVPVLLMSCSKDVQYSVENTTEYDVHLIVKEYNDNNECIKNNPTTLAPSEVKQYVADESSVKIKVYESEFDKWVDEVFYLKGDFTKIVIKNSTILSPQEP